VGRGAEILELLPGEDVEGDQVDLGVAMLSSLGSGHVHDLAWATLDHDVSVLAQGGTLHRVGGRGTSIGAIEGMLVLSSPGKCQQVDGIFLELEADARFAHEGAAAAICAHTCVSSAIMSDWLQGNERFKIKHEPKEGEEVLVDYRGICCDVGFSKRPKA
jgi:hypothetical protein